MAEQSSDDVFVQEMLEGTAEFQRHCHAAWDPDASFEARITHLPLYALEFNNADRGPRRHGPSIAHYSPARREIVALARMCRSLGEHATVLDAGCGNGFIGTLLAREAVRVIGIDDLSWNRPQIESSRYGEDMICMGFTSWLQRPSRMSTTGRLIEKSSIASALAEGGHI